MKNLSVAGHSQPLNSSLLLVLRVYHAPPYSFLSFSRCVLHLGNIAALKIILYVFVSSFVGRFLIIRSIISGMPRTNGSWVRPRFSSVKHQVPA